MFTEPSGTMTREQGLPLRGTDNHRREYGCGRGARCEGDPNAEAAWAGRLRLVHALVGYPHGHGHLGISAGHDDTGPNARHRRNMRLSEPIRHTSMEGRNPSVGLPDVDSE